MRKVIIAAMMVACITQTTAFAGGKVVPYIDETEKFLTSVDAGMARIMKDLHLCTVHHKMILEGAMFQEGLAVKAQNIRSLEGQIKSAMSGLLAVMGDGKGCQLPSETLLYVTHEKLAKAIESTKDILEDLQTNRAGILQALGDDGNRELYPNCVTEDPKDMTKTALGKIFYEMEQNFMEYSGNLRHLQNRLDDELLSAELLLLNPSCKTNSVESIDSKTKVNK